jgi:hypothetical protein
VQKRDLYKLLPALLVLAAACAWLFTGTVITLYGPYFHTALLNTLSSNVLLPERILFPGLQLTPSIWGAPPWSHPPLSLAGPQAILMLVAIVVVFLFYMLALRYLPRVITLRFILISTCILGLVCAVTPVVTSQDIYSYIIYDRMIVYHHLNPLTTIPSSISSDPAFSHLYWPNQPSAYGPTYIAITSLLQLFVGHFFGHDNVGAMVIGLRLLSIAVLLCSTWLIWDISGRLLKGKPLSEKQQKDDHTDAPRTAAATGPLLAAGHGAEAFTQRRILVTLAFAWNPLLVFEAAVNAHNDILVLLGILVALWIIVRTSEMTFRKALIVSAVLALMTCLKANTALVLPGFLLFFWWSFPGRRLKVLGASAAMYVGLIIVLYAPFWQNGTLLHVLAVNPGTMYNENTLVDTLGHLYNSVKQALLHTRPVPDVGSAIEIFLHRLSLVVFVLLFLYQLWRVFRVQHGIRTPLQLVSWMTWAWLLYCAIGSPWMWPWYLSLFFGLFALLEIASDPPLPDYLPLAVRLLSFSLLSIYVFFTWGAYAIYFPLLPNFRWSFWRGFWAWLIPLGAVGWIWLRTRARHTQQIMPEVGGGDGEKETEASPISAN